MPDLARVLKDEVRRLSRKELKDVVSTLKKQAAQYRRDIADLKRQLRDQSRRLTFLEKQERRRVTAEGPSEDLAEGARFSPARLRAHRKRLGLSAEDYAKLVGVSPQSIYLWEQGKTRPRKAQLAALVAVRDVRKREAQRRLELIG
jgi:DNA-binding transcriptional regulator YiaG